MKAFFLNAFPPRDKRDGPGVRADLSRVLREVREGDFEHTLFTAGAKRPDPWIIAQEGMREEKKLSPLVAVNPLHQHPVSIAKRVATLSGLYPQRIALNLIPGSFFREHQSMLDESGFHEKTERLLDYIFALRKLLTSRKPVHHDGKYYPMKGVELYPHSQRSDLRYFVSGGLSEKLAEFDDTFLVKALRPSSETSEIGPRSGFLVGVCARKTREEAIQAVTELFPEDPVGKRMHEMSLGNELTPWASFIREYGKRQRPDYHYYLRPLENFWSPAPYIVGSYEEVAEVLRSFRGTSFFILDYHENDFPHVREVIRLYGTAGAFPQKG